MLIVWGTINSRFLHFFVAYWVNVRHLKHSQCLVKGDDIIILIVRADVP